MRVVSIVAALFPAAITLALAQTSQQQLSEWIPAMFCVTNNCCYEVSANDVESLPKDRWQIRATGQVLPRTDWSPDGRYYRCACDYVDGKWIRHLRAHTRCIFPPMRFAKPPATPGVTAGSG